MEAGMIQTLTRLGIVFGVLYAAWLIKFIIYLIGWLGERRPRSEFLWYYDDSNYDYLMIAVTALIIVVALLSWIFSPILN